MSERVGLEMAKFLKKNKYPQKTGRIWLVAGLEPPKLTYGDNDLYNFPAPSVGELLDKLPIGIGRLDVENYYTLVCGTDSGFWYVAYQHIDDGKENLCMAKSISLADSLGEIWVWLKDNNYLNVENLGEYSKIDKQIQYALAYGKEKHDGQFDDEGKIYFQSHCIHVFEILKTITKDKDILIAGILHDTLEDTETEYVQLKAEFGKRVADLVHEVTHEGQKDEHGYYFPRLKSRDAILIKLADRISNLSRMGAWDEQRQKHYLKKSYFWRTK